MVNRRTNKRKTTEGKPKGKRKPVRQLIFRIFILLVLTGGILAYGSYRYGWQVFGQKIPRLWQKGPAMDEEGDKKLLDEKIKSVIDKVKQGVQVEGKTEEETPEPVPPDASPTPTPTPEPAPKSKSDKDQLKDFLDSKMK